MIRKVLILTLLALLLPASAGATLRMYGNVKQRHWTWAHQAQVNVPLANAKIWVYDGDPVFFPDIHVLTVPFYDGKGAAAQGWTAHLEKGLFLHELGHVFDTSNMTPAARTSFIQLAGVHCRWWGIHCVTHRWVSGPDVMVDLVPGEMFAEEYMACALGLTRRQVEDQQYNTYGWQPPDGVEPQMCALIRSL
jgi:hypothetical protein